MTRHAHRQTDRQTHGQTASPPHKKSQPVLKKSIEKTYNSQRPHTNTRIYSTRAWVARRNINHPPFCVTWKSVLFGEGGQARYSLIYYSLEQLGVAQLSGTAYWNLLLPSLTLKHTPLRRKDEKKAGDTRKTFRKEDLGTPLLPPLPPPSSSSSPCLRNVSRVDVNCQRK